MQTDASDTLNIERTKLGDGSDLGSKRGGQNDSWVQGWTRQAVEPFSHKANTGVSQDVLEVGGDHELSFGFLV